ncbi:hypothetical protein ACQY0O_004556 [Thecaphora frezii]
MLAGARPRRAPVVSNTRQWWAWRQFAAVWPAVERAGSDRSMASSSPAAVAAPPSDKDELRHAYRALLRRVPASVRFSRPATSNLARLLRTEIQTRIEAPLPRSASASERSPLSPAQRSEIRGARQRTLALLLASSHSPRRTPTSTPSASSGGGAGLDLDVAAAAAKNATAATTVAAPGDNAAGWSRLRQTLAHRLVANLSSLTYHHLSPHTRMQSLTKRRAAAEGKPKPLSSLARLLHRTDDRDGIAEGLASESCASGVINATADRIDLLRVPPKPVLGPKGAKLPVWDAQDPDKLRSAASVVAPQEASASGNNAASVAERDIETLRRGHNDLARRRDALKPTAQSQGAGAAERSQAKREVAQIEKQQTKLQVEIKMLERKLKTLQRSSAKQDREKRIQSIAIDLLADTVSRAQSNEKVWIGKSRWGIRRRGGWLPP